MSGSDNINHLRNLPAQLRETHRAYAKKLKQLKENDFLDDATRKTRLAALAVQERAALADIKATAQEKAQAIRTSAVSKNAPVATEAEKAQVLRALDNGASWNDIARLCASQKNRGGLAALREQLPWEAAAGKLGDKSHAERLVKEASSTLDAMERPLLTEPEARAREELRELDACYGAIETNFKTLDQHYIAAQNPLNMLHQQPVNTLYNWFGLPTSEGKSSVGCTSTTLQVNDPAPMGYDAMSMNMRPVKGAQV